MTATLLVISNAINGAQASDSLDGGGTGIDMGNVATSSFAPLTSKNLNQGARDLYIRQDGATDVQDVATFIQQYGVGTSFTYGGAASAAADFATMKTLGLASGGSKNNIDGLSGGLWIDMSWNANDSTRFDQANLPALVKIYGDNNTDGVDLSSAFPVVAQAMVWDNAGTETAGSVPADGVIGPAGDTVNGDNAHVKLRIYLPASYGGSGKVQTEWVVSYTY